MALCLTLALTSAAMALARGQARDVSGAIVLCAGLGVVTVTVDSRGNPVGALHVCPDCALFALAAVASPEAAVLAAPPGRAWTIGGRADASLRAGRTERTTWARAPPVA